MKARAFIAGLTIVCSGVIGSAQGRVTHYDVASMPLTEVNANIRIKKIMGEIGTFMIGVFKAGWKSTPHHHSHEQINVGVSGAFNIITPVTPHKTARLQGVVIPADVLHGNDVSAETQDPVLIEFQPVRRVDFPPEREKVTFKIAGSPNAAPANMDLDFRSDSPSWRSHGGARMNVKNGKGVAVSAWELPATLKDGVEVRPQVPAAETFLYVLDGNVDVSIGADQHTASAGVLLVIAPNSPAPRLSAKSASVVLIFEAARMQ
jgi:quercetin dioxygenase-like cupin family protein